MEIEFEDLFEYEKPEKTVEEVQSWCTSNHKEYFFSLKTVDTVPSGLYNLCYSQTNGYGIQRLDVKKEDFIDLPSSPHQAILEGIKKFWANKEKYVKYGLTPKRGIILYGQPGCGKTSCIYLLVDAVRELGGIAVYFNDPNNWIEVARMVRKIEKDRPILCIIEDLDAVIARFGEDVFLNFLDGLNQVDNVVYVATTNHIHNISDRIKNRPSRFDQLYEIVKPTQKDIEVYFNHLVKEEDKSKYNIKKLAKDAKDFSMAHLRELFVSLYIMDSPYKETIDRLKNKKIADSTTKAIGFGADEDDEDDIDYV